MSARDTATAKYVADNGGERWEIPGDEAFEAGWDAGAKAIVDFIGSIRAGKTWSEIRDNVAREFEVES